MMKRNTIFKRIITIAVLLLVLIIILSSVLRAVLTLPGKLLVYIGFAGIIGLLFVAAAVMYLIRGFGRKGFPHTGTGRIIKNTQQTGFDTSFAMGQSLVPGSGFFEQGQGGSWQFAAMFWNEIRPDNWFPMISYRTENGQERIGTISIGSRKNQWKENQEVKIAWADEDRGLVKILDGRFIRRKACTYAVIGLLFILFAIAAAGPVSRAAASPYSEWIDTMEKVRDGITEKFDGTIEEEDNQVLIAYQEFTGTRTFTFECAEGTRLIIEKNSPLLGTDRDASVDVNKGYGMVSLTSEETLSDGTYRYTYDLPSEGEYTITVRACGKNGTIHIYTE